MTDENSNQSDQDTDLNIDDFEKDMEEIDQALIKFDDDEALLSNMEAAARQDIGHEMNEMRAENDEFVKEIEKISAEDDDENISSPVV